MTPTFTTPTIEDAYDLSQHMRDHDADESLVLLGHHPTPLEILGWCGGCAEAWAVRDDAGMLICIFGVRQGEGYGIPWLLGTDVLDLHMLSLCKRSRSFVDRWVARFGSLRNMTDKRNRRVILWLRWLGFQFQDEVLVGEHPFVIFFRNRHV